MGWQTVAQAGHFVTQQTAEQAQAARHRTVNEMQLEMRRLRDWQAEQRQIAEQRAAEAARPIVADEFERLIQDVTRNDPIT